MNPWNMFDARCTVGRHLKLPADGLHTPEHLLDDMDRLGIAEALVLDSLARENHPLDGNVRILDAVGAHPRLHPAWAALPTGAPDEQAGGEALLDEMRRHHVGALFLFPRQYRFTLDAWCIDALLEPFAAARVPIFIDYNEISREGHGWDETDWPAVVALCRRWPALPVVVSEWRIRRAGRLIYRALEACPNLRIELGGYWLHRGIEYIAEHWGPHRLVFGSHWPELGPACTLTTLTTADVSDDAKRLIAGDNLRALIRWCGPPQPRVTLPPPEDDYAAFARSGQRPESMTFLDCHGHLGGRACHYHLPNCSLDGIVADMNRLGVQTTCAFSFGVVFGDERFGNDAVAEAVRRYPDRFVGFTGLNPHRGAEEMLRELERGARLGLRGVKLIPWYQGYPEDGPLIETACRWAHEHGGIILNHNWGTKEHLESLLAKCPDACFFTGHATTAYAALMRRYPNLYVCTCPVCGVRDCENLVRTLGADRILFGSDLEDLPIAWGLGPILLARIGLEEKRLILGENLRRVLSQFGLRS